MTAENVRLGDVVERIRNGLSIRQSDDAGGLPITRIETISTGSVNGKTVGFAGLQPGDHDEWLLQAGDILVSHINSMKHLGKCAIYEGEPQQLIHGMNLLSVRPHPDRVFPKYLFRVLSSPVVKRQIPRIARQSVNQSSFGVRAFSGVKIPLPPLPEQRRIAAILDKADAVRSKRQQTLDLADQFLRSAFLDLFGDPVTNPKGWPVVSLSDLGDEEGGGIVIGPFGSDLKVSDYRSAGHPVVFVRDIQEGQFSWNSNVYVDDAKFEKLSSHLVRRGDVVATKMGTPPGIAAAYPTNMQEGIVTADIVRIRPDLERIETAYLTSALNSAYVKAQIKRITEGVTRPKITLRAFRQMRIPMPPLDLQRRWSQLQSRVQGKPLMRRWFHSRQLEELQGALAQRAFRGGV
jgi:type I restriction enzyme, S subunit